MAKHVRNHDSRTVDPTTGSAVRGVSADRATAERPHVSQRGGRVVNHTTGERAVAPKQPKTSSGERAVIPKKTKVSAAEKHEKIRRRRVGRIMLVIVLVAVAFMIGFVLRGNDSLMSRIGVISPDSKTTVSTATVQQKNVFNSLSSRVSEIEDILNKKSLDEYKLDDATDATIDALIKVTDDSSLHYYNPARYAAYVEEAKSGSYAGIGVLFAEYNGQAYAVDVFSGSVAEAAGVQVGDFVVDIDGDRSQHWTAAEVANSLSRQDGDKVTITWRRPSSLEAEGGEEFTTQLECKTYSEPNVTTEMSGHVGIIKVKQFTQNAAQLVNDAVKDLDARGAEQFVLDLRDCPGGYLTQGVDIASLFIKSGVIVQIQTKDNLTNKTAKGDIVTDKPLVVLVNGNTAGAAEVVAAALQEDGRASVVGSKTMGKGSVQVMDELSFGGALRYTAALYKTPLGRDLNGVGVTPDISLTNTDPNTDTQMTIAIETARTRS